MHLDPEPKCVFPLVLLFLWHTPKGGTKGMAVESLGLFSGMLARIHLRDR